MKTFRVLLEIEFIKADEFDNNHMLIEPEISINDPRIKLIKHKLGETVIEVSVIHTGMISSLVDTCIFDPAIMKEIRIISTDEL